MRLGVPLAVFEAVDVVFGFACAFLQLAAVIVVINRHN